MNRLSYQEWREADRRSSEFLDDLLKRKEKAEKALVRKKLIENFVGKIKTNGGYIRRRQRQV